MMLVKAFLAIIFVGSAVSRSHAWTPSQRSRSRPRTALFDSEGNTGETEKLLRQQIADRNTAVPNEGRFGVADGEFLERIPLEPTLEQDEASSTQDSSSLSAQMERLTKPRAYPLFVAEKAAELVEATVGDLTKSLRVDDSVAPAVGTKERIVVLGTGWGGASFLKGIDTDFYDVTVISPRNYFLFTPMLAGASVGTVEFRSVCEPIRAINPKVNFLEATANAIDPEACTVTCESVTCDGNSCEIEEFTVPYDRLVVTIGAQTNTFGIPGVREHCCFLREVEDARRVRTAIVNCFERANLPSLTDEERVQNLTFAIIGAGPTGIEFAAELRDFVEQDGPKYYPDLLKFVRIKVIEASSTVLAPFDKTLQQEAIAQLERRADIVDSDDQALTELLLDSSVKEVTENQVLLNDGAEITYGLSVWAAGNGPIPLTLQLIDSLGEEQTKQQAVARGRIAIDPWMRVVGGQGRLLSFGDCSCITNDQLPATAQVASQQGEYLANMMNHKFELSPALSDEGILPPPTKDPARTTISFSDSIANFATNNSDYAKPFQFLNLGILAYTGGGSALAQVSVAPDAPLVKGTGKIGNAVWRSVYLSKQVSARNRVLVVNDWIKRQFFGRDITRL